MPELARWQQEAACRGMDPARFYLAPGCSALALEAKRLCDGCAVKRTCLTEAVQNREREGIWGGAGIPVRRYLGRRWTEAGTHHHPDGPCGCGWCAALDLHFARLSVHCRAGRAPPGAQQSFGPQAVHGRRSTYKRGCLCDLCCAAEHEHERST